MILIECDMTVRGHKVWLEAEVQMPTNCIDDIEVYIVGRHKTNRFWKDVVKEWIIENAEDAVIDQWQTENEKYDNYMRAGDYD